MYKQIACDYLLGIWDSIGFIFFLKYLLYNRKSSNQEIHSDDCNTKLIRVCFKILKYNICLYLLPLLIDTIIEYVIGINIEFINMVYYPIAIFSTIFHILHYMDIIDIVCINIRKHNNDLPVIEQMGLAITLTIYQLVIYLSMLLINFLFYDKLYIVAIVLDYFVLSLYHSFYYYNNLWLHKKIPMGQRIIIHENMWPYYIGYGTLSTIIYSMNRSNITVFLYNIYMVYAICAPFLLATKYPPLKNKYPALNLRIFAYTTNIIIYVFKSLLFVD